MAHKPFVAPWPGSSQLVSPFLPPPHSSWQQPTSADQESGQAAAPDASLGLCPGGGTFSQAPKLFLADQNASFGCMPLYWISLHLPAPGF